MMQTTVSSDEFNTVICEALGLDANKVTRIVIDVQPGSFPIVYAQMVGSDDLLKVEWEILPEPHIAIVGHGAKEG